MTTNNQATADLDPQATAMAEEISQQQDGTQEGAQEPQPEPTVQDPAIQALIDAKVKAALDRADGRYKSYADRQLAEWRKERAREKAELEADRRALRELALKTLPDPEQQVEFLQNELSRVEQKTAPTSETPEIDERQAAAQRLVSQAGLIASQYGLTVDVASDQRVWAGGQQGMTEAELLAIAAKNLAAMSMSRVSQPAPSQTQTPKPTASAPRPQRQTAAQRVAPTTQGIATQAKMEFDSYSELCRYRLEHDMPLEEFREQEARLLGQR